MGRRFVALTLALGAAAVGHAAVTWGPEAAAGFVVLVAVSAFLAELAAVRAGALVHHARPQLAGVPVAALAGWTGAVYLAYRAALAIAPAAVPPPVLAAALATAADALVDHHGVEGGLWDYPPSSLSNPRIRGVPWWNFAGWFVLTLAATAAAGALGLPGG